MKTISKHLYKLLAAEALSRFAVGAVCAGRGFVLLRIRSFGGKPYVYTVGYCGYDGRYPSFPPASCSPGLIAFSDQRCLFILHGDSRGVSYAWTPLAVVNAWQQVDAFASGARSREGSLPVRADTLVSGSAASRARPEGHGKF